MDTDTDTNGAITDSMSESYFEIYNDLIIKANTHLPDLFINNLEKGYERIKKI